jgi:NitT/TauT family transport system substrate-binding protein
VTKPADEPAEITTVRVGALPISSLAPFYIAEMKGYFKAEGLTNQTVPQFGPQGLQVLEAGQMDLNFGDTISTTTAIARGFKLQIVAPASSAHDTAPDSATLIVAKGSPIKTPKDLDGKKVAVDAVGGIGWLLTRAWVEKRGVDSTKLQYVELPFGQMPDAVANGQVDAAEVVEPARSAALKAGKVEVLGYPFVDVQPGMEISHVVAKPDWVAGHPITLRKWLRAYQRGIDSIRADEAGARKMIAEYAKLDPSIAEGMAINAFRPTVNPEQWQKTIELMVKFKVIDQPIQIREFVHELALNPPK